MSDDFARRVDGIGQDALRAAGSVKWTLFEDAIGAFVAESDLGLAPPIAAALHTAVDRGLTGYLPVWAATGLVEATRAYLADHAGWAVDAADIRPVADVLVGLRVLLTELAPPGAVIVPTPAYMPFLSLPKGLGREVVEVPSPQDADGRYRLDLEGIAAAFEAGASVLVLCNPWNPVGRVLEPAELQAVGEVVARYGGRVFSDEIHAPMVFEGRHIPYASVSPMHAEQAITSVAASKAWNLPGLKCAQIITSNDADRSAFERFGGELSHGASTFGVVATTAAYREGGAWLADATRYLDANRLLLGDLLAEHLPQVRYRPAEGSYIGWLDVSALGFEDPAATFRAAGVALTDGRACGVAGAGHVRLVFATPAPILTEAVRRMAAAH